MNFDIAENSLAIVREPTGELNSMVKLDQQGYELLQGLSEQDSWKLYRKLLVQAKDGYVQACLPLNDPNQVMKTLGMVAGLNFAINQLGLLVAQYKIQQAKSVAGETKNQPPSKG